MVGKTWIRILFIPKPAGSHKRSKSPSRKFLPHSNQADGAWLLTDKRKSRSLTPSAQVSQPKPPRALVNLPHLNFPRQGRPRPTTTTETVRPPHEGAAPAPARGGRASARTTRPRSAAAPRPRPHPRLRLPARRLCPGPPETSRLGPAHPWRCLQAPFCPKSPSTGESKSWEIIRGERP